MSEDKSAKALDLKRAGVPLGKIATELGYKDAAAAGAAVDAALDAVGVVLDPERTRRLGVDRMERLIQVNWLKAVQGDSQAFDRVLRAEAQLRQLVGSPLSTVMVDAYQKTIAELHLPDLDSAVVTAGSRLAERIDASSASLDAEAATKAMHLVPHLMNVLRELGATPAARAAIAKAAAPKGEGRAKIANLRALRDDEDTA
jgi:hypothetical protein